MILRPHYLLMPTAVCTHMCALVPALQTRFPVPRRSVDGLITIWSVMDSMTDDDVQQVISAGATPCGEGDIKRYLDANPDLWYVPVATPVGLASSPVPLTRRIADTDSLSGAESTATTPAFWNGSRVEWCSCVGASMASPMVLIECRGWVARSLLCLRRWRLGVGAWRRRYLRF